MKVKIKFNRRYSMICTLLACGASLWLMMRNFHFPAEEVLRIGVICVVLVLPVIIIAALIGFITHKVSDRHLVDDNLETQQYSVPDKDNATTLNNNEENEEKRHS